MPAWSGAGLAALAAAHVNEYWLAWLDIAGDVIRVTDAPYPISFAAGATGDADLDTYTFARTAQLITITEISHSDKGADTVTAIVSGIPGIDTTTLNQIGNRANWQTRAARVWGLLLDDSGGVIAVSPYTGGYMVALKIAGSATSQTISLEIESFLSSHVEGSGRTWLNQAEYDANDNSAAQTIAAANGLSGLGTTGAGHGGNGGGGSILDRRYVQAV